MYVDVTDTDADKWGPEAKLTAKNIDGRLFLRMKNGHCAQLQHLEGDWVCGIYSQRPKACHELKRGSPPCLAERELKRLQAHKESKRLLRLNLK